MDLIDKEEEALELGQCSNGFQFKPQTIERRGFDAQIKPHFNETIHPLVSRIYKNRGVYSFSDETYSIPQLTPPATMKGLSQATEILKNALINQKKILVIGDFDVDGATSTCLSLKGLRAMGFNVDYLIPDRFVLGYGLSTSVVEAAVEKQPDIIMTVDNGIASLEGVAAAQAKGWQVIVTDHHLPAEHLPNADAIVNPNQPGCEFPSKNLAGVGVVFYLLIALRARLRDEQITQGPLPNLADYLDLVALGTVADLVPLDENNRRLVALGLARMKAGRLSPGLVALAQISGRKIADLNESDLGFAFGPRLNAAGRLDDMSYGVECLMAETPETALVFAEKLDALNQQRRQLQSSMQAQADAGLTEQPLEAAMKCLDQLDASQSHQSLCVFHEQWHQGIVGLLASRLKDHWYCPVIAFAEAGEDELKGSGRSIPGIHLRDILDLVDKRLPGSILKFGGHSMAAGLSIRRETFEAFQQVFQAVIQETVHKSVFKHVLLTDGVLPPQFFTLPAAAALATAGPFGQGFPEPQFDGLFEVLSCRWLKEKHLKIALAPLSDQGHKAESQLTYLNGIMFQVPLSKYHENEDEARRLLSDLFHVKLVYRLNINRFNGQSQLQLMIDYLEPLEGSTK